MAEILLWTVLLVQAARFAWLLFAPASMAGTPQLTVLPAQIPALAGHDPFFAGTAATAASPPDGWRLFGLRTAANGQGTAILGRDSQPQAAFRVGDEVAPGLVLARVGSDHVELGDARLELEGGAVGSAHAAPAQIASAPAPLQAVAPAAAPGVDPAQLLEAGLQARTDSGRITGYTLLPRGNSEALLRAAGLRPGDVLLTVDGQFLSPSVIAGLAGELKTKRQAVVTFERDGQTRTLNLGSGTP